MNNDIATHLPEYYRTFLEEQLKRPVDADELRAWIGRYFVKQGSAWLAAVAGTRESFKAAMKEMLEAYIAEATAADVRPATGGDGR